MQPPWSTATSTTTAPFFILAIMAAVTSLGAAAPGISTPPTTGRRGARRGAMLYGVRHRAWRRVRRTCRPGTRILVRLMSRTRDLRAHAERDLRRVHAHDAAADDDDLRRRHARDAAQQHAAAAVVLLEIARADLDRHAARDLAHRASAAAASRRRSRDGLVGDAGHLRSSSTCRQPRQRGQVEIGEEDLALAHGEAYSDSEGSFTFTTMSARFQTSCARVSTISAPAAWYSSSEMAEPARRRSRPAPGGRSSISAFTPPGTMPTRYSLSLISVGRCR